MPIEYVNEPTRAVRLRGVEGQNLGSAVIPAGPIGPEAIRRGDQVFVRKTHDVYHLATSCVVSED